MQREKKDSHNKEIDTWKLIDIYLILDQKNEKGVTLHEAVLENEADVVAV